MAVKETDCEHCPSHKATLAEMSHLTEKVGDIGKRTTEIHTYICADLAKMKEEINANRESLNRRIAERIPIRHAITATVIAIGIITTIITFFADSNRATQGKLEDLKRDVAILTVVSREKEKALQEQQAQNERIADQQHTMLLNLINEIRGVRDGQTSNIYSKPKSSSSKP